MAQCRRLPDSKLLHLATTAAIVACDRRGLQKAQQAVQQPAAAILVQNLDKTLGYPLGWGRDRRIGLGARG